MSLHVAKPPGENLRIIREALVDLFNYPQMVEDIIGEIDTRRLRLAVPHQVYFVGLLDAAEGHVLSSAELVAWRYILDDGERALAAVEVGCSPSGENLEFSHINEGPYVEATVQGVRLADSLIKESGNDFELRLLNIPSLYIVSLWLFAERSLLIPLPPTVRELESYSVYMEEPFTQIVRDAAWERLRFDEAEDEAGGNTTAEDEGGFLAT